MEETRIVNLEDGVAIAKISESIIQICSNFQSESNAKVIDLSLCK